MTYSYDPSLICEGGLHQMRFQLGDTCVRDGDLGCALCDEEYNAVLSSLPSPFTYKEWLTCKISLVEGILHKLAFQVDTKIDVLEYDLSSRVAHWESVYSQLKEEESVTVKENSLPYISHTTSASPSFYSGVHDNCGSAYPTGRRRWRL